MRQSSGLQQLKEAKQIARDHGLFVVEKPATPGQTNYIVYRHLPNGRNSRLGVRKTVAQLIRFVSRLATTATPAHSSQQVAA